jgi:hypothetical protein
MKRILKQLPVCSLALAYLLHLDKDVRPAWKTTQSEVNSFSFNGIFRTNNLRLGGWPTQSIEDRQYYALGD